MNKKNNYFFVFIILAITLSYGTFQARAILSGPEIIINSPKDGSTLQETLFTVSGSTKNVTHMSINGKKITMNTDGKFSETLITPDGYGIILIEGKNRFGKTTKKRITFIGTST